MTGEVISLISSSPPARRIPRPSPQPATKAPNARKRRSDEGILNDITDHVANSQTQAGKRVCRDASSSPPPRRTDVLALTLSDLSDSSDFPELSKMKSRQGPLRKDPRRIFNRTASYTGDSSTRNTTTTKKPLGARSRAFDDPIELSSTPDFAPNIKSTRTTAQCGEVSTNLDPFTFSPSPERKTPSPNRRSAQPRNTEKCLHRSATVSGGDAYSTDVLDTPSPISDLSPPRPRKDWDPISSSAPELQLPPPKRDVINIDSGSDVENRLASSDDSFPDIAHLRPATTYRSLLPNPTRTTTGSSTSRNTSTKSSTTSRTTTTSLSTTTTTTKRTAEERARDKQLREAEKEKKKQAREEAKAQKAREKARAAALAEVNKARTDKKISAREMIVELPSTLDESLALQAQTLLKELQIEDVRWQSPVDRVVRWRRRVRARYDEEKGHYEPVPERVERETFALVVMTSEEFIALCLEEEDRKDLQWHVGLMKRHFPDHTLLYLIQGLDPWMRRNRNLRNRQFAAAVRNAGASSSSTSTSNSTTSGSSRRKKPAARTEYVDEDVIEDGLLALQVNHGVMIHHTNASVETARWIVTFTQHISTVPYRRRRDEANASAAAFCMDVGQVRSGEDAADTYVRMLQEITRVTAPVAYGIAAECPSVSQLVRQLELGGPLALQDWRKCANRDGDLSDRTIGQALSKRMHKVFTGRDETSTDV